MLPAESGIGVSYPSVDRRRFSARRSIRRSNATTETRRPKDACHGETDSQAVGSMANGTAKGMEASQDGSGSIESHAWSWKSDRQPGICVERS
jgi:hypothetical protein